MRLEHAIKPRTVGLILALVALCLAAQSIFGEYILTSVLHHNTDSVPALILDDFSVNAEQTIPTWYSVILLLIAAVLLAAIAQVKLARREKFRWYWLGLAIIFLYLSID